MLLETLPKYLSGQIQPIPQDNSKATYCPKITKDMGKIDWHKSAQDIERQIRAFYPWPGSFTLWSNKTLKILKAEVYEVNKVREVGEVFRAGEGLGVYCGQGALEILELQLEGKKPMNAKEFLNGYPKIIGSILK